ncbi:(2Fe-2S)-binding protein [Methylobacterium sp. P31]
MIVCSCNVLSADEVRSCAASKAGCPFTPAAVYRQLGCRARCGRCVRTIRSILSEAGAARSGCPAPACAGPAVSAPESWMTQGSLARIAVKPVLDLDQGMSSRTG